MKDFWKFKADYEKNKDQNPLVNYLMENKYLFQISSLKNYDEKNFIHVINKLEYLSSKLNEANYNLKKAEENKKMSNEDFFIILVIFFGVLGIFSLINNNLSFNNKSSKIHKKNTYKTDFEAKIISEKDTLKELEKYALNRKNSTGKNEIHLSNIPLRTDYTKIKRSPNKI